MRSTTCVLLMCKKHLICKSCAHLRNSLRKAAFRQKKSSEVSSINSSNQRTSVGSHTSYHHLTSVEKDTRMRNMHHSLTMAKQRVKGLQSKMDHLIDDQGIHLVDHDASDSASLMKELNPIVQESFQPHTPQRLFWDQQIAYNALKDKRQMRWHPLVIRFALNLKYLSTSSYRVMRQSGIIHFPSERIRTLSDYTHWTKPHSGISLDVIEEFVRMMDVQCGQN